MIKKNIVDHLKIIIIKFLKQSVYEQRIFPAVIQLLVDDFE